MSWCTAGKVSIAVAAAQHLVATACWYNAYYADLEGVTTGLECAFQFMAAFGMPADTSDMSSLIAWLGRMSQYPMGLVLHCPPGMSARLQKHVTHNVEKVIKVSLRFA